MRIIAFRKNNLVGALMINGEKNYVASTATKSKNYKTERGARAFLEREGYIEVPSIVEQAREAIKNIETVRDTEGQDRAIEVMVAELLRFRDELLKVTPKSLLSIARPAVERANKIIEAETEDKVVEEAPAEEPAKESTKEPVLENKVTIDKDTLRFNCPSEDGLNDRGCKSLDGTASQCRKCWEGAIMEFLGDTKGKDTVSLLGCVAREEIKELTIEEYSTKLVYKCNVKGKDHKYEFKYGETRDSIAKVLAGVGKVLRN